MELIIFIGIQATGKSEFYKRNFYKTHIRLNLDMLRTRNREKILMEACLYAKQPLVIDNTNPTRKERRKYIAAAKKAKFTIKGYYFNSSIADSILRNEQRTGLEQLPVLALKATHKKLELPLIEEGFDELWYVKIGKNGDFITEEYQHEI